MPHIVRAEHGEALSFSVELQGHNFTVDSDADFGGTDRGPRPKALLLAGLAGCTGMDVASMLGKMKMHYDSFAVEVDATQTDEHPKVYKTIHLRYLFAGDALDRSKVQKAVDLSLEKYCGVSAMLSKTAKIEFEIVFNPA